jgi:dihydroorotate dehydrogenase electron transfer subunit
MNPKQTAKHQKHLRVCTITEIIDETPTIKTFMFKDNIGPEPTAGQFVMVWVPGVDEVPMSVSYTGETKGITVASVGNTTEHMHQLKVGSKLGIRGPYGNGFDLSSASKILAIAGGCGSAPIGPALDQAAASGKGITLLLGARTRSELLFRDRAQALGIPVEVTTDDGSEGFHGFATQRMEQLVKDQHYDLIITCGPEVMMKKAVDIALNARIPVQASLERYMKCGIGICDACAVNGFQVCRDGPVFNGEQLAKLDEFGSRQRDACGRTINV